MKTLITLFVLLVLSCTQEATSNSNPFCILQETGDKEIVFSEDAEFVPTKRSFIKNEWADDETKFQDSNRFPLMEISVSSGKFDPNGLYVKAFLADAFKVSLVRVEKNKYYIDGIRWPASFKKYNDDIGHRNDFLNKYSSAKYYVVLNDDLNCDKSFPKNLTIAIYDNNVLVETILFGNSKVDQIKR